MIPSAPDPQVAEIINKHLFLGSQDAAVNVEDLDKNNIKYILNVAFGIPNAFPEKYQYKNVEILDVDESPITNIFQECFEFINLAKEKDCGVLVHWYFLIYKFYSILINNNRSNAGVSRSASVVIGYLMKHLSLGFNDAYNFTKERRSKIKPNPGFIEQLKKYKPN